MLTIGLGPASVAGGGGGSGSNETLAVFKTGTGNTVTAGIELQFGTSLQKMFYNAAKLTKIEKFDTSGVTKFVNFLSGTGITSLPDFDFSNAENMDSLAASCSSLKTIPVLYLPKATDLTYMFNMCTSLVSANIDCPSALELFGTFWRCAALKTVTLKNTDKVTTFRYCFNSCTVLETVSEPLRVDSSTDFDYTFENCSQLQLCKLHGLKSSVSFANSKSLTKESILYTIENAQTVEESQTIILHADVFAQLSEDEIAIATEKGFSVVSA